MDGPGGPTKPSAEKKVRRRWQALALVAALLLVGGCGHRRVASRMVPPPPLAARGLEGQRALVVPADEGSAAFARSLARHLSVLPLRVLESVDLAAAGPDDLPADPLAWQARAWSRRIPFVLLAQATVAGQADDRASVQLLPAREGEPLLTWKATEGERDGRDVVELRGAIHADFGLEDQRPDGHPSRWMVCPPDELDSLRVAVLMEPGPSTVAAIQLRSQAYPLDPALIELEGIARRLSGEEEEGRLLLRRAQAFHPSGSSELPRLARLAARTGMLERQLTLLRWAVEIWPDRLDLSLALAAVLDEEGEPAVAAEVLLDASSRVDALDPDALDLPDDDLLTAPALARIARRADLRYSLGWLLHQTERRDAALGSYALSRRLYEAVAEPGNAGTCANNTGVLLIEVGRPLAAVPPLRQALSARMLDGISLEASNTLYNLGAAYQELGRFDESADALRRAADGYGQVGAAEDRFDTLLELVVVTAELGRPDDVETAFEHVAGEAAVGEGAAAAQARALDAVGVARARVDRFDESMAALNEALASWVTLGDRLHEGQTRYNMAIPLLGRGDLEGALAALAEARLIAVELGDAESVVAIDRQMEQIEQMR
jgi:tetratricopeptide (TPR) repeat protein